MHGRLCGEWIVNSGLYGNYWLRNKLIRCPPKQWLRIFPDCTSTLTDISIRYFDWNLGRTEIENKRCCEMPHVLAHGFRYWHWDWEAVARISVAPWAHVCVVHMLPLSSETGEGALASHEEAFLSLSNVSLPSGDLLSAKWQCPQVMHYSAATWGPQMCCGSSSQDVLCPGDNVPVFGLFFCFNASG